MARGPLPVAMKEAAADVSPFRLGDGRRGVLLVHGFTGCPFEMRLLGESLAARGFSVEAPALAGHGPDAARLRQVRWEDWVESVERAFDAISARCEIVGVAGLSMGGLLSLDLALSRGAQVKALALMAPALWLPEWQMRGVRRASRSRFFSRLGLPKLGGADVRDAESRRRIPTRDMPIGAIGQLVEGMDRVRPRIGEIDRPALVIHGAKDHTIPPECSDALAAELRGPVERMTLERSYHVITLDVERDALMARVGEFFLRML